MGFSAAGESFGRILDVTLLKVPPAPTAPFAVFLSDRSAFLTSNVGVATIISCVLHHSFNRTLQWNEK